MLHAFRTLFGIDDELLTPVTERERTRMVRALGTEAAVASHLRGRAPRVGRRIWILGGEHVVCLAASDRHVVGCHPVASIRSEGCAARATWWTGS